MAEILKSPFKYLLSLAFDDGTTEGVGVLSTTVSGVYYKELWRDDKDVKRYYDVVSLPLSDVEITLAKIAKHLPLDLPHAFPNWFTDKEPERSHCDRIIEDLIRKQVEPFYLVVSKNILHGIGTMIQITQYQHLMLLQESDWFRRGALVTEILRNADADSL